MSLPSKPTHTPGPWKDSRCTEHTEGDSFWRTRVSGSHGGIVASAIGNSSEESIGNARLITAAPDMAEALRRIIQSAPIVGLPLALEKDIQDACYLLARIGVKS